MNLWPTTEEQIVYRMLPDLTETQLQEYLAFALNVADEAATMVAKNYGNAHAQLKFDGSLVTEIDERSDRLINERIAAAYPDHNVLSEEQSTIYDPAYDFTWVVDPIDGTTNFARGLPIWGVSIALMYQRSPVVGVLVFPLLHEIYSAALGLGATHNGKVLQSAPDTALENEQLVVTCTRTSKRYTLNAPFKARILGSAAYHLAKVADGTALASIEASPKIWDLAGAAVILQEAGALLCMEDGSPVFPIADALLDYKSLSMPIVAAGNDALMAHVRDALVLKESMA